MLTPRRFFYMQGLKHNLTIRSYDWCPTLLNRTFDTLSDFLPKVRFLYYYLTSGKSIFICVCLTISQFVCCLGYSDVPTVNMPIIAHIESSGRPNAVSYMGARFGRGTYQISEILLKDYCEFSNAECPKANDLFNPTLNSQIATWAFEQRFPAILRWLNKPVTLRNLLICYNAGCGKVDSPPLETRQYIKKYERGLKNVKQFMG